MIWLVRRLAAATWLERTPLARIYYMNPRPSMPPGSFLRAVERGEVDPETGKPLKVGGGSKIFAGSFGTSNTRGQQRRIGSGETFPNRRSTNERRQTRTRCRCV
jgi:hypothetical protein